MADQFWHVGGGLGFGTWQLGDSNTPQLDFDGDGKLDSPVDDNGRLGFTAFANVGHQWKYFDLSGNLNFRGFWNVVDWNKDGVAVDYYFPTTSDAANHEDIISPHTLSFGAELAPSGRIPLPHGSLILGPTVGFQYYVGNSNAAMTDDAGNPIPGTQIINGLAPELGVGVGYRAIENENLWGTVRLDARITGVPVAEGELRSSGIGMFDGPYNLMLSWTMEAPWETKPKSTTPEPVVDTDGDGISDDKDKCINIKEDIDRFEDNDGCPDPDNDGDGILDEEDACPYKAETKNGYLDEDGCPDAKPLEDADADTDGDGLLDDDEKDGYDIQSPDGGLPVHVVTDPFDPDSDDDGLTDGEEVNGYTYYQGETRKTNPKNADTDGDKLGDGQEVGRGIAVGAKNVAFTKPGETDETVVITDPFNKDTDGDTLRDGAEIEGGPRHLYATDPTDPDCDDAQGNDNEEIREYLSQASAKGISVANYTYDSDGDGTIDPWDPTDDKKVVVINDFCTTAALNADMDRDALSDRVECDQTSSATTALNAAGVADVNDVDGDGHPNWDDNNADNDSVSVKGNPSAVAMDGNPAEGLQDRNNNGIPAFLDPTDSIKLEDNKIVILDKVFFEIDSAVIKPESYAILNQVADVLKDHPEITLIRIEGHTDDVGDDAHNLDLSERRAESVERYLIAQGIEDGRMNSQGFGETRPLANVPAGTGSYSSAPSYNDERATNRRVEFVIVKKDE